MSFFKHLIVSKIIVIYALLNLLFWPSVDFILINCQHTNIEKQAYAFIVLAQFYFEIKPTEQYGLHYSLHYGLRITVCF